MKYRDIAKRWIWTNGFRLPMTATDGTVFGDKKVFTDSQLDKANDARLSVGAVILRKWQDAVPKAERKTITPLGKVRLQVNDTDDSSD